MQVHRGKRFKINFRKIKNKFLQNENVKIVIQINGKKKDLIKIDKEINEEDLLKKIYEDGKIAKHLNNIKIKKTIFIKNKLINLII